MTEHSQNCEAQLRQLTKRQKLPNFQQIGLLIKINVQNISLYTC